MALADMIADYQEEIEEQEEADQQKLQARLSIFAQFCKVWLYDAQDIISGEAKLVAGKPVLDLAYNQQTGYIIFDGQKFNLNFQNNVMVLPTDSFGPAIVPRPLLPSELIPFLTEQ